MQFYFVSSGVVWLSPACDSSESESSRVPWTRGAARLRSGTGAGGPVRPDLVLLTLLPTCWEMRLWLDCTTQEGACPSPLSLPQYGAEGPLWSWDQGSSDTGPGNPLGRLISPLKSTTNSDPRHQVKWVNRLIVCFNCSINRWVMPKTSGPLSSQTPRVEGPPKLDAG